MKQVELITNSDVVRVVMRTSTIWGEQRCNNTSTSWSVGRADHDVAAPDEDSEILKPPGLRRSGSVSELYTVRQATRMSSRRFVNFDLLEAFRP